MRRCEPSINGVRNDEVERRLFAPATTQNVIRTSRS
jgi:hypothetical protein